jgi:hypothetical protein
MSDQDGNGNAFINIAPGRKMQVKTVAKPLKTNPYVEPPSNNNFMSPSNNQQSARPDPFQRAEPSQRNQDAPKDTGLVGLSQPQYQNDTAPDLSQRRGTPERQSLLDDNKYTDNSFVKNSPYPEPYGDEDEPESYAIFEDDMSKIKKFKEDYNTAYEKDKDIDRKLTVQQIKQDQLVEHSNELVDKKEEFKQALMEIMKENARLEQRNEEMEEDIKELEDAIEKGIKLVNDDEEDEDNLNLFMVGDPTKLHEMKIERERRKLKRALINALDYMEGKESRLTGIKEHKSACRKFSDKMYAVYIFMIPLKNDLLRIQLSYDKSIESFFNMFRFLVNFNFLTA